MDCESPEGRNIDLRRRAGLDRDLTADLDDSVGWEAEEIADVDRIPFHHREYPLLPCWQPGAVLAVDHGFVTDIISDVAEVDSAAQRLAGGDQFRNIRTLHEAE